jgi:6-phosphogluconolactonase (cycloisomerase 2 family)
VRVSGLRRCVVVLIGLMVWGAGGLWAAGPARASELYYTSLTSNSVLSFGIAADGSLSSIPCPGSGCDAGAFQASVAVSPNGRFLYAPTFNGTVAPFAIAADGSLSPIACPGTACNTSSTPSGVAVSPNGHFLYVGNNSNPGSLSAFAIAADGSLSPIPCSGTTCSTARTFPGAVAVSPDGQFLYTADAGTNSVSVYAIGSDGSLAPVDCPGNNCNTGANPFAIIVSPDGHFLYTANSGDSTLSAFAIGADGTLTPIPCPGSDCNAGFGPRALAVSPNGRFLYLGGGGSSGQTLFVFAIASDGSLSPVSCSGCTGGTVISGVVVSPDGRHVYAASGNSSDHGNIRAYAVGADGSLSPIDCGSSCNTENASTSPQSMAISPDQAPVAAFTAAPRPPGEASTFDGSGSTAAPGQTVARYDWSFGDGTSAANGGATPSHTYAAAGNYTVTLTVTDDAGCSTAFVFTGQTASCNGSPTAEKTLTVRIAAPPTAQITTPGDGVTFVQGQAVSSSFSCSDGANGPGVLSCVDQSDHPSGSAVDTSAVGSHTFTVTATSKDGQTSSKSVTYQVAAPSGPPPPPSNRFEVKHIKVRANGFVSFAVKVPGPGAINVLETAWKNNFARAAILLQPATGRFVFARSHSTARRPSTLHFKVKPNKRGRRLVAHHRYKVRIRLWVTYQPTGGSQRKIGFYGLRITR